MSQGSSALAFLVGDFTGSGATEIAQLWDNDGILGLIVYGIGNGTLEAVSVNPNTGQGSGALAFLAGYFTGAGTTTQIAQPWDNNGTLEMIVYGYVGNNNLGLRCTPPPCTRDRAPWPSSPATSSVRAPLRSRKR